MAWQQTIGLAKSVRFVCSLGLLSSYWSGPPQHQSDSGGRIMSERAVGDLQVPCYGGTGASLGDLYDVRSGKIVKGFRYFDKEEVEYV